MLTVTFLIVSIFVLIGLILYLFFWNRVIGYVLSLLVRIFSWNQGSSNVWVDIGKHLLSLIQDEIRQSTRIRIYPILTLGWENSIQGSTVSL
jgi:hypothetical protein